MLHRDPNGVVTVSYRAGCQSGALGPQHNGQLWFRRQPLITNGNRVLPQGHRRCLKAQFIQPVKSRTRPVGRLLPYVGPWNLEYRSHAHPHRPPVQRVTTAGGQQHRVNPQGRRRTDNGTHIGGVHYIFQHSHPSCPGAHLSKILGSRPPHGAQHPSGQLIAGQPCQYLPFPGVKGDLPAACNDPGCLPFNKFTLGKEGQRLITSIQRQANDGRTFRNKHTLFRFQSVAQLRLGQSAENIQLRPGKISDLDDLRHFGISPFLLSPPIIAGFSALGKSLLFAFYPGFSISSRASIRSSGISSPSERSKAGGCSLNFMACPVVVTQFPPAFFSSATNQVTVTHGRP